MPERPPRGDQMMPGPFERNGTRPRRGLMAHVTALEAAGRTVAYLEGEGLLDGTSWEALGVPGRETWARAFGEVYVKALRDVSKDAVRELAAYEDLTLAVPCRACGAGEGEACRDRRVLYVRHNRHPHEERMAEMEARG